MQNLDADVIIVGAGITGLCSAITLKDAGLKPLVLEKSSRTGGRVATDTVTGYRIDRGFQILLSAYPEVKHFLDLDALELGKFQKGAHIWTGEDWQSFYDPRSAPFKAIPNLLKQNIFNLKDSFLLLKLWHELARLKDLERLVKVGNRRTCVLLEEMGFSERSIKLFFEPFLGGVFLESKLHTSEKMFRFVMKMFIQGSATLPNGGMKHIPEQLTMRLGIDHLRCETCVKSCDFDTGTVQTEDGISFRGKSIVLACDAYHAHQLCPEKIPKIAFNHTRCFAFGAEKSYTCDVLNKTLRLVANPESPIQVIAAPSRVVSGYAPPEHDQIIVTLREGIESPVGADTIVAELETIFGKSVHHWELLKEYRIPYALPRQLPADLQSLPHFQSIGSNAWAGGDYLDTRSLNGAMASGRLLGERLIQNLKPEQGEV